MTSTSVFECWAPAGSPWSPWAKPVLFAHGRTEAIESAAVPPLDPAAKAWVHSFGGHAALIADLPGATSLVAGLQLAAAVGMRPVPLYNTCPGPAAVVEVESLVRLLFGQVGRLASLRLPDTAPPVFLLDSNRRAPGKRPSPGEFDNRWVVFPQDFPSAKVVREHGLLNAVVWQPQSGAPAEDLAHVLLRWQEAGITIWTKGADPATAPEPIAVRRPAWYRSVWHHLAVATGLRRSSSGGFGALVPHPSSGRGPRGSFG